MKILFSVLGFALFFSQDIAASTVTWGCVSYCSGEKKYVTKPSWEWDESRAVAGEGTTALEAFKKMADTCTGKLFHIQNSSLSAANLINSCVKN